MIAPVTAPPEIHRQSATLIRPGEAIPFGRPYRTHLNGPRKLLTSRKRVRPLPARILASRHASPHSPDHHSSSSNSYLKSSPVHSLGLDASDQAHSGSSTRDVSPRLWTGVDMELGISNGDEVEDHVESDHRDARDDTEEYEADANTGDTAEVGIDPMTTSDALLGCRRIEIVRDGWRPIKLIASGDRARACEMIYSLRLENLKEEFCQIRRDRNDARGSLRRLELYLGRRFGFRP
ncbi:hypothetical protein Tco_1156718 [Tanacetum coccineum]